MGRMKRKDYYKELASVHVELVKTAGVGSRPRPKVCVVLRRPRGRRQGRHHQGNHRARESRGVFRVVALPAPSDREKEPDVPAALRAAFPGRRRSSDLPTAAGTTAPAWSGCDGFGR